jgi:nucleoside phosphorylase
MRQRHAPVLLFVAILPLWLCACASDDDGSRSPIAVISAFPAELAAVLEHTAVESTIPIAGRNFRIGTIGSTPVVVGMTGIGLVNAAETTRALLETIDIAGIVISGVAGSPLRIGDVAVPASWTLVGESTYSADSSWLEIADGLARSSTVSFEHCTVRPAAPEDGPVCLLHEPQIAVGGIGESDDPFGGNSAGCQPNGGDVFGCDVSTAASAAGVFTPKVDGGGAGLVAAAVDMETAAIAREAVAAGVPFIAFRAVSDGEGDPLNLPGFPAQFFTYYRLAAHNAAAAAAAFLADLP